MTKIDEKRHAGGWTLFLLAAVFAWAPPAVAQGTSAPASSGAASGATGESAGEERIPIQILLGAAYAADSNVQRLPEAAPDPVAPDGSVGKSDRYATASLGLRMDMRYSQQHFVLDASQRVVRYDRFDRLDRDELDYRGAWNWRLGQRFSGVVRADRQESLVGVLETQERTNNVRVTASRGASATALLYSGIRAIVGVSQIQTENSVKSFEQPDSRQTGGELGLSYTTRLQNSIAVLRRHYRGKNTDQPVDFVNFIDSDFEVDEIELTAGWIASPNHAFNGRLTWIERRHANLAQRDFKGRAGEATYRWTPTDRLTIALSATRSVQPWTADLTASAKADQGYLVSATWLTTEKISLSASGGQVDTDYFGGLVPGGGREDRTREAGVAASWAPTRALSVSASLRREARTSTDAVYDYKAGIGSIQASLSF